MNKQTNFFHNKLLFGLDIGNGSLKVMQIDRSAQHSKTPRVTGYGTVTFDSKAIDNGVIVEPEIIAKAMLELFEHHLIGDITTRRVALAIPAYRTFGRSITLPKLSIKELEEAVRMEAEQYIPEPLENLYLDYTTVRTNKEENELFAVAVPKKIVDSYLVLTQMVGLEAIAMETTLDATARIFSRDKQSNVPTVIIDFGSLSADISIYDGSILVTGTVQGGGLSFTNSIEAKLGVSHAEAALIKTKYGLGLSKKQKEIVAALTPTLEQIVKEIRRMMRYYEERYGESRPISQVIMLGGGANMPGLGVYFTDALRLAVRACDPWSYLAAKGLQPPSTADKPMYSTVAGLSLVKPKEVFV